MPFTQTPSLNIHYELGGTGNDVLVLLHGNFASWRWWRPVLERLPANYRAYAPDLRGCGDTDQPTDGYNIQQLADDLYAFVTALELRPFHLVGHSLGGAVALQFALDHPEYIETTLLVAPAPAQGLSYKVSAPSLAVMTEAQRSRSLETLEGNYRFMRNIEINRPWMHQALSRMALKGMTDSDFKALVDDAARMAPEAMVGYLQSLDAWDVQAELSDLQRPILILWGTRDKIVPLEGLYRTARGLPQGRVIKWNDVGHAPQLEQPDRFIELLDDFTRRKSVSMIVERPDADITIKGKLQRLIANILRWLKLS